MTYQQNVSHGVIPQSASTKVELYFSCQKLKNMDVLSKSDPVIQIERLERSPSKKARWIKMGCTEMIKDDLNPKFNKTIQVEYRFEKEQKFRFKVFDIDQSKFCGKVKPKVDDLIGSTQITLSEVVGVKGQAIKRPLLKKNTKVGKNGFITIRAEEVGNSSNDKITIFTSGIQLKKMDLFGKSDGYFILQRRKNHRHHHQNYNNNNEEEEEEKEGEGEEEWIQIYKSEIVKCDLNPEWKPVVLETSKLCRCDLDMPIRCWVYDWDRITKDDKIGYFDFTARQLYDNNKKQPHIDFTLQYDPKPKSRRGQIRIRTKIKKRYSFFEYLRGGLDVSLIVAIDFTLSNRKPHKKSSLHYHGGGEDDDVVGDDYMNEYQCAIRSIGDILSNYDSDNMYPVYGFGAKLPPDMTRSHCFAVNGNESNPYVVGVDGILNSYKEALENVKLDGPTYFHEIIDRAVVHCEEEKVSQDIQKYYILLIITDGVINKIYKTIHSIVQASYHPLAIIIVGVGNADFTAMDELDCDDGILRSTIYPKVRARMKMNGKDPSGVRRKARADIVQFVPFSKFKNSHIGLAAETLAEVPDQVVKYFKWKKIVPNSRPQAAFNQWDFMKDQAIPNDNNNNMNNQQQFGDALQIPQMNQQPQQVFGDSFQIPQPSMDQQEGNKNYENENT